MPSQETEVLVVGAGQAGVAMSEHLTGAGVPHLVLERGRIAERWRSERWDSLVANGPAWHDRFPGLEFTGLDPDGFAPKERVADYFVAYAEKVGAPIRCGVEVTSVRKNAGQPGFRAQTSDGAIDARYVVAATGPFQRPVIPPLVPDDAGLVTLHSSAYRNPEQLPSGAVLVVGAGSSGVQIADELRQSGRPVYLSVGPHDRPPRRYRGRDFCWWLGVLGKWDIAPPPRARGTSPSRSAGRTVVHTVDFRALAASGITLAGRAVSFDHGTMRFAPDLGDNIARGDAYYLSLLDECRRLRRCVTALTSPRSRAPTGWVPIRSAWSSPVLELDLARAGVTSIVWATGFAADFCWLHVDAFDSSGKPQHQRGVSSEPGVYFLGLPWQSRRGSSFIWGVWHDARVPGRPHPDAAGLPAYGLRVSPSDSVVYGTSTEHG